MSTKADNLSNPDSCWNKALPEELVFVLLGRDPASVAAVLAWCSERVRTGKNQRGDAQITSAISWALDVAEQHGGWHPATVKGVSVWGHIETAYAIVEQCEARKAAHAEQPTSGTISSADTLGSHRPTPANEWPWCPHPTAPGWMWNTKTNEVISDAEYSLRDDIPF